MAIQVSPGVSVSEVNLTTTVPGISTSVGAIAGAFSWGPVGTPILVSTQSQYANTFGKPITALNSQTFWTGAQFLSYGNAMYVTRAANTTTGISAVRVAYVRVYACQSLHSRAWRGM